MKRLEKLGVKFPVTLNPKDEKEEEADFPISQGKTDENKKEWKYDYIQALEIINLPNIYIVSLGV